MLVMRLILIIHKYRPRNVLTYANMHARVCIRSVRFGSVFVVTAEQGVNRCNCMCTTKNNLRRENKGMPASVRKQTSRADSSTHTHLQKRDLIKGLFFWNRLQRAGPVALMSIHKVPSYKYLTSSHSLRIAAVPLSVYQPSTFFMHTIAFRM
jgi:hypothetical protein